MRVQTEWLETALAEVASSSSGSGRGQGGEGAGRAGVW